jgi:hypothetical protein
MPQHSMQFATKRSPEPLKTAPTHGGGEAGGDVALLLLGPALGSFLEIVTTAETAWVIKTQASALQSTLQPIHRREARKT